MTPADLPVDLVHWLLAVAPILLVLILLAGFKWKPQQAGPAGMLLAAVTSVIIFQVPLDTLAAGVGTGIWDAIFILLVVWPALVLYRVTDAAGAFAALRAGIDRISRNQLFIVLAFGWVFASFMQGVSGFGVPVAVVAPLLVALGVRPVLAVVIPLIGHAWANLFGTLGVAWLATGQVTDLADPQTTAVQTALLLWIPNLLGGVTIAWLFGRWRGLAHATPFVLIISAIHGGGQLTMVLVNPSLAVFVPAAVALVALYPLSRWRRYAEPISDNEVRPGATADASEIRKHDAQSPMSFRWSLIPYLVLGVTAIVALTVPPLTNILESFEIGPAFPETDTGYQVHREAQEPYSPLTPLTHPMAPLLLSSLITWTIYKTKGFYAAWTDPGKDSILRGTASDALPASLAVVTFLVLAGLLDYSGQTDVLALGISAVVPGVVYAVLANTIGILGAFITTSNTSSNVLFAGLQQNVAISEGLPESAIIAAQGTGGAIGNVIAPTNIVLGATTAGIHGQEGRVLRMTLPWAAALAVIVGAATLLMV